MDLSDRLKELRHARNLTQGDMARKMGLSERQYQNLELRNSRPRYEMFLWLADFFGVSLDYLAGRSDER